MYKEKLWENTNSGDVVSLLNYPLGKKDRTTGEQNPNPLTTSQQSRCQGIHLKNYAQYALESTTWNRLNHWFPSPRAVSEDTALLIPRCFHVCTFARVAERAPAVLLSTVPGKPGAEGERCASAAEPGTVTFLSKISLLLILGGERV